MRIREIVRKKDFDNWLWENYDKQVCSSQDGYRGETCPVARFIKSQLNKEDVVEVFGESFYINNKRYESPKWVEKFIEKFDETVTTKTCKGKTALTVLYNL